MKNKYPLPRIEDLFDQFKGASVRLFEDRPMIWILSVESKGSKCAEDCI